METETKVNGFNEDSVHESEEKSVKFMINNNEGTVVDSHVIEAEVNHEPQDPQAFKRRGTGYPGKINGQMLDNEETFEEEDETEELTEIKETSETPENTDTTLQTSENFIKMEEKNVIERLQKVVDTELTLETTRVDTFTEEETTDDLEETKLETEKENESIPEPQSETEPITQEINDNRFESEPEPPVPEAFSDFTDGSVVSTFTVTQKSLEMTEENGVKVEETTETFHQTLFTTEKRVETQNEEQPKPVVEDVVIKQNGRKTIYSSEEDIEEDDGFPEIIGFKNTLKMWSIGKPISPEDDIPQIKQKDKFQTVSMRQIKRGNTRSLMEKFQQFKS